MDTEGTARVARGYRHLIVLSSPDTPDEVDLDVSGDPAALPARYSSRDTPIREVMMLTWSQGTPR